MAAAKPRRKSRAALSSIRTCGERNEERRKHQSMIPKSGSRFSDKIMLNERN
jgi:hypothetical protein